MNSSGDAAEQVIRISLEGAEFAARISGKAAKEIAVFLFAALQGAKRTKGKARLASMLRSGKELKVFSLSEGDLWKFAQEAKKYGVLYAALKGVKKSEDGLVDIMVKAEDASKVNRIFERFSIAAVDTAAIRSEVIRAAEERATLAREVPEPGAEAVEAREQAQPQAERPYSENPSAIFQQRDPPEPANPSQAGTESSTRSGRSSPATRDSRTGMERDDARNRPSVRRQLDELRAARDSASSDRGRADSRTPQQNRHQPVGSKKPKYKKKGR